MMNNYKKSNEQYLLSGKSENELLYRSAEELELIEKLDRDSKVLKIDQFLLPLLDNKNNTLKEEAIGFILNLAGGKTLYLVVSAYLTANPHLLPSIKQLIGCSDDCEFKCVHPSEVNFLVY